MRTKRTAVPGISATLVLLAVPLWMGTQGGCGGTVSVGSGETYDGGSGSSGATSVTGSTGSSGTTGVTGSSGTGVTGSSGTSTTGDGGTCVTVQTSEYDTSCTVDSDCINVTMGTFCQGQGCFCGNASINAGAQNQYAADLQANGRLVNMCDCLGPPVPPRCVAGPTGGVCTYCGGSTGTTPGCGSAASDGGTPDSGVCIDFETSMYDTSCQSDSDCTVITTGTFCQDEVSCLCGNATVNLDGGAQYKTSVASLDIHGCTASCAINGTPKCLPGGAGGRVCTYCPSPALAASQGIPIPTACADGGT